MAAHFLVVKLFLFTATQVDFVLIIGEYEHLTIFPLDYGSWLRNDEFF